MQYTPICQGISFEQGFPSNSPNGTVPVAGGPVRYGIFSRSLTSCAEVAKPMGWTNHSTVAVPMLEHRETVHQLSRSGTCTSTTTAVFGTAIFRWVRDRSTSGES